MKFLQIFIVLLIFVVSGCSGEKNVIDNTNGAVTLQQYTNEELFRTYTSEGLPMWAVQLPVDDEEYFYVVAEDQHPRSMANCRQEATNTARQEMAQKLDTKVRALQKAFNETVTSGDAANYAETFTNVSKQTAEASLQLTSTRGEFPTRASSMVSNAEPQGPPYKCFMVMSLAVGEARSNFENALSTDEELYVKFKESKAFEEFEKEFPTNN